LNSNKKYISLLRGLIRIQQHEEFAYTRLIDHLDDVKNKKIATLINATELTIINQAQGVVKELDEIIMLLKEPNKQLLTIEQNQI